MEKTLSSQANDWREGRRLRAFELKERGWKQTQIADALGVSEGAVSQWMKRAREKGVEGLRHKPPPGAPPRLSEDKRARLPELLAYAPLGETPILHESFTRDHLSVMSGITLEGKLYMLEQDRAFKGEDVVRFLKHLMHQIPASCW